MSFSACPGDVSTLEQSHSFLVTSCLGLKSIGKDGQIFSGLRRDKKSQMVLLPIDPALQIRLSFRTIALAVHFFFPKSPARMWLQGFCSRSHLLFLSVKDTMIDQSLPSSSSPLTPDHLLA